MTTDYHHRLSTTDTSHSCDDHVDVKWIDWETYLCGDACACTGLITWYRVTCPACGHTDRARVDTADYGADIPDGAVTYTDPGWEVTPMTTITLPRLRTRLHPARAIHVAVNVWRTARAHLPHSSRVHAIWCTACWSWVQPRRFDPTTMTCRDCG